MEERKGHRKHSKEFEEEAIRLVVEGGRPVIVLARCLDNHENMLRKCMRQHKADPAGSFPDKGHLNPQDEEMRRLQQKLVNTREERDFRPII